MFDNLYFLGQTEYTAWAVTTSDGIIVIDPLFDYSVEEEVVNGLTKLGLDPKRIRYVVVSHAHSDHVGGAALLQQRGARVVMSAADWELLATDPGRWPKAKKDIVATDGYKLTLGDTTLTLHFTPGHTLGHDLHDHSAEGRRAGRTRRCSGAGPASTGGAARPRYITPDAPSDVLVRATTQLGPQAARHRGEGGRRCPAVEPSAVRRHQDPPRRRWRSGDPAIRTRT